MKRARQSWGQKPTINSALLLGDPQEGLPGAGAWKRLCAEGRQVEAVGVVGRGRPWRKPPPRCG